MTAPSALLELIGQARRRTLGGLLFNQLSLALAIAFGAGILLVLLGTQIFNWYWPLLLFAVALGFGYYRFRQQIPSNYALARRLDERLALPDTLSTAFHFTEASAPNEDARRWMGQSADAVARGVDAAATLPFKITRVSYVAALTLVGFLGLIGVRYGFEQRLDLASPMVPGLVDLFGSGNTQLAELRKNPFSQAPTPNNPLNPESPNNAGEDPKEQAEAQGEAPKDVLKTIGVPDVDNQGAEPFKGEKGKEEEGDGPGEGEKGQPGDQKEGGASKEGSSESKDGSPKNESAPNAKNQSGEKNSMLDKMRDAFSNLMNKMKSEPKGGEQQAKNGKKDASEGEGKQGDKQGQKGEKGQQGKQNDHQAQADQASDQQGEGEGKQQTAQGKGGSDSNSAQPNNDPKSGTGAQDGQKDVKLAAQMEAMGKLSEIIGKRAEKQSGEVMVEVNSSKSQQLRTAYSSKTGTYTNSGGEIHRDEVPLLYQDYVQHYFEQVRRPAAPATAIPKTK